MRLPLMGIPRLRAAIVGPQSSYGRRPDNTIVKASSPYCLRPVLPGYAQKVPQTG